MENRQNYIDILCLIQIDMHVFWSNKPQNYVDIYNAWLAVWYYLDTWCKSKWHHGNICTFLGFSPVHRSVQKRRRKNVSFEPKIGTYIVQFTKYGDNTLKALYMFFKKTYFILSISVWNSMSIFWMSCWWATVHARWATALFFHPGTTVSVHFIANAVWTANR